MINRFILLSILVLLPCSLPLQAQDHDIEISGLVIDRTLTRFGKDFNFYYASYWRDLPFTQGFNVTLIEQVFPQAGTSLTLLINDIQIYKTYFGRRASPIKERAEQAILLTIDHIANTRANALMGELADVNNGF
ncbi:curli production assembly/transport protein CsgE [Shewanella marina]|uniref:curli production assembly/transport protein CsgE n=1 Tax=Shewanella marina TaxID=487319 RepID=UPI0004700A02|nr:curli production assembly/transport protein CsgE [Shewanella marina]